MSKVKVCGLTDARNAWQVADAGADFAGFIFYPRSKRFVGETPHADLFMNIPSHVKKVGVFVNEKKVKIIEIARKYQLDLVQLHGAESAVFCNDLKIKGISVMKAFGIGEDFDFEKLTDYKDSCDFFLFDTQTMLYGGSGIKFRWERIEEYKLNTPFFLGGGIGPLDVQKVRNINHPGFFAADINSRFETAPGIKNIDIVKTFIQHFKNI
jgi:phosphoribosylanthranilate isomerase